ncbi:helix-turn-helix domain-containing protein [uncultured Paraglaciecola sp.]|uniref:helix-turn-helix domain-containing protein n=1 Tax=uncultured Paraglaciecola sp. TaxID=1765024 RepID=UPI00262919F6|nr:helix-turn-helix domain-containing protein [uncultured Paraglaciecola sp.]
MSLMTVEQVSEYLGVQSARVERLERESLLPAADKDANGNPLFEKDAVEKYKVLAERLGGI